MSIKADILHYVKHQKGAVDFDEIRAVLQLSPDQLRRGVELLRKDGIVLRTNVEIRRTLQFIGDGNEKH